MKKIIPAKKLYIVTLAKIVGYNKSRTFIFYHDEMCKIIATKHKTISGDIIL